jgi:hypothetical protein
VCDPPPLVRSTFDLNLVSVERPSTGGRTRRVLIAGLLGGTAGAFLGHSLGPSIGFGQVYECVVQFGRETCSNRDNTSPEKQRASDQKRGAMTFGVITGSLAAILANKLADDWVSVEPAVALPSGYAWGLAVRLPGR